MADDGVTELDRNQRGELWVRGQNIMKGYWHNPQATKETKTEDGWLKTGDIAFVDDEALFHIVDRKKVFQSKALPGSSKACLTDINRVTGAHQSKRQPGSTCGAGGHPP